MAESSLPRLLLIGLLVGAVSGVGAVFFFKGIELGSHILLNNILGYRHPTEGLGFEGRQEGISCHAVCLLKNLS